MHANIGDEIRIKGRTQGQVAREGEILDVMWGHGTEHYRVRWGDGHESVLFPSSDAEIVHHVGRGRRTKR